MITKVLALKTNDEFVKLMNDGGLEVSDDRRKQTMDATFQSFMAQNGINEPNGVSATKTYANSKKKGRVDDGFQKRN